jgi:hypothetical protein
LNTFLAQAMGDLLGLEHADFAQLAVAGSLAAVLEVPIRRAMAN